MGTDGGDVNGRACESAWGVLKNGFCAVPLHVKTNRHRGRFHDRLRMDAMVLIESRLFLLL